MNLLIIVKSQEIPSQEMVLKALLIMLTIELGIVNKFGAHVPISFEYVACFDARS